MDSRLERKLLVIDTLPLLLGFFIVLFFVIRILLVNQRFFDKDEFECLHASWCLFKGMTPYKDFFENHPPLTYYLLLPLFHIFGETLKTIFASRYLMQFFTICILIMTYFLGRLIGGRRTGLFSVFFLSSAVMFLEKTIEVRPDMPESFFWELSLLLSIYGIKKGKGVYFVLAGFFSGISFMFSQKMIFAFSGLALYIFYFSIKKVSPASFQRYRKTLIPFVLTFLFAIIMVFFVQWIFGALQDFFQQNFIFNFNMYHEHKTQYLQFYLKKSFLENFIFWIFGAIGFLTLGTRSCKKANSVNFSDPLLCCIVTSLLGLFLLPSSHRQYYLIFLPLVSICAGVTLNKLMELKIQSGNKGLALFVAIVFIFIIFSAVYPFKESIKQLKANNNVQIAFVKYVWQITGPDDTVFDCWTGTYVFRHHAYFYWYLNWDIQLSLKEEDLNANLIKSLKKNNCKVVLVDRFLGTLPGPVHKYIIKHYRPTRFSNIIWRLKENTGTKKTL